MAGSGTARYSKMTALINYRLRVTLQDGRVLVGQLIAFDKHMNLVLSDCEEFRRTKKASAISSSKKKALSQGLSPSIAALAANMEERRTLGLLVLRGENVISIVVEAGPPPDLSASAHFQKTANAPLMPGAAGPAPGLAGAIRGVAGGTAMPASARPPPMPMIPGISPGMMPPPPVMPHGMMPPLSMMSHGMVPPLPQNMMMPPPPPPPQFHPPPS